MIVIPTFNGYSHLSSLINSFEEYGTNNHEVLIVDGGTTELISVKYLEELKNYQGKLKLTVVRHDESAGSYETGAFVYAFRNFPSDKYMLMHDSCIATSEYWLQQFEDKLTPDVGVVSWVKFLPCLYYVGPQHFEYIHKICTTDNVPDGGIFGSIFFTHGHILKELDAKGCFNHGPQNKVHSESWERIWPILFHQHGCKIEALITGFNPGAIHHGHYPHLRKTFGGRGH